MNPRQISDNAGLDATDVLNKFRMRHATGEKWAGVDVDGAETVRDNLDAFVWEPSLIKINAISSAVEAACLILSVDETVKNPQSEQVCIVSYYPRYCILTLSSSPTLDLEPHQELLRGLYVVVDAPFLGVRRDLCSNLI
jgi:hypothetical protein